METGYRQGETGEYLTVRQVAERWGISPQAVTAQAASGRIPGARKEKGKWQIPAGADKPSDRRRRPAGRAQDAPWWWDRGDGGTYGPHALSTIWFPPGGADRAVEGVEDGLLREQLMGELAYLRGRFEEAEAHLKRVRESGREELLVPGWFHTVENALHLGDWAMMLHGLTRLNDLAAQRRRRGDVAGAKAAELAVDTFVTVCNAPERCRKWIQEGDFSQLPARCLVDAAYARCKYLQNSSQMEQMLSEYRMAASLIGDNPFWRGYPAVMALLAYSYTRQTQAADLLASGICRNLMADGLLVPIMDDLTHAGQFLLRYLDTGRDLRRLGAEYSANWRKATELLTGNRFIYALTDKEIETMWLASAGMSNKEIAQHLNLSVNTIKLRLQTIYEKLHITSRKELKHFIYFG